MHATGTVMLILVAKLNLAFDHKLVRRQITRAGDGATRVQITADAELVSDSDGGISNVHKAVMHVAPGDEDSVSQMTSDVKLTHDSDGKPKECSVTTSLNPATGQWIRTTSDYRVTTLCEDESHKDCGSRVEYSTGEVPCVCNWTSDHDGCMKTEACGRCDKVAKIAEISMVSY
eukprot:gnl/TRDRNA2_/TRDRNA2_195366_c0_seq1.p1 gnl/TRDRNA2_/TRDRNA2_195366_c0~~gnl/TRDRNA2_/TRDRNA2_195366_c0_seq1.p1  ORF type:complete len:174 (-),score=25.08 gnl/TRDRNA2_/TRDRNA2_195366_c0_seq1:115-636(-)